MLKLKTSALYQQLAALKDPTSNICKIVQHVEAQNKCFVPTIGCFEGPNLQHLQNRSTRCSMIWIYLDVLRFSNCFTVCLRIMCNYIAYDMHHLAATRSHPANKNNMKKQ